MLFNIYSWYPEATLRAPMLHDGIQHLSAIRASLDALNAGQDPSDVWYAPVAMGFPLTHYYQHLAYVVPAVLAFGLQHVIGDFPLDAVLGWFVFVLLSIFPLSIYWSMRRLGFERSASALSALVCSLISTNGLFGFEMNSYAWRGYGLYTQLWGMVLLPPALAQAYAVLRDGRGYFAAVVLLAATCLSHLAFGYIVFASLALLAVLAPSKEGIGRSVLRYLLVFVPMAIVISYFMGPLVLDSAYLGRSVWDAAWKYDSYGAGQILGWLIHGDLFDSGRFAALTIAVAVGAIVCVARWREPRYRVPLSLTVVWLLLYFGRPTWGAVLDLMPLSQSFYFHRLISGVHLGGIYLMGIGFAVPLEIGSRLVPRIASKVHLSGSPLRFASVAIPVVIVGLFLNPVYQERWAYQDYNKALIAATHDAFDAERADVDGLLSAIKSGGPGRVYAGLAATWGGKYKIGEVPMQGFFTENSLDTLSMLYHVWSLPGDVQVLFSEDRQEEYNLFNLRYIVAPADRTFPDWVHFVGQFGRHRLYEVDTTGFFDLVDTTVNLVGTKNDFFKPASEWLHGPQPAAREYPVIWFGKPDRSATTIPLAGSEGLMNRLPQPAQPDAGHVLSESVSPNRYASRIQVDRASTVLVKVNFHPNWHAYVDGVEAKTEMLMPSFIGIPVSPGTHDVRIEYRPQPLRGGLMILGLITLILTFVAERRRVVVEAAIARSPLPRLVDRLPRIPAIRVGPIERAHTELSKRLSFAASRIMTVDQLITEGASSTSDESLARSESIEAGGPVDNPRGLAAVAEPPPIAAPPAPEPTGETATALDGAIRGDPDRPSSTGSPLFAFIRTDCLYLIGVLLAALLGGLPMLQLKLMSGHDYLEYVPRNVEFFRALTNGQLIPRWAPDFSGGFGEPFFAFNPPMIYALTAAFHATGASFIAAEDLACFALLVLAGVAMYLFARDFVGRRGGLVAAAAFVFSPFLDSRLYVSHALADYSAFPFVPLAYWGVARFTEGARAKFLAIGALAIALMNLSSNPVSLITLPTVALLVALIAVRQRSILAAVRGAWCVAVGMGLSAFFWLPALMERDFVHVHRLLETFLNYSNHFAYISQLIYSPWGYGVSLPGPGDGMSFMIGPLHLALTVVGAILLRWVWQRSPRTGLIAAFAIGIVLIGAFFSVGESSFIWDRLPLLQYLEYPWRFHVLVAAGSALLCGLPLVFVARSRPLVANALMGALLLAVLVFNYSHASPQSQTDVTDAGFEPATIAARWISATTALEYEPIWVRERPPAPAPANTPVELVGSGSVTVRTHTPIELHFTASLPTEGRLRINTFYFPSWRLEVDGRERVIDRSGAQGVIEAPLDAGTHDLRLALTKTPAQGFGEVLSLVAILTLIASVLVLGRFPGLAGAGPGQGTPGDTDVLALSGVRRVPSGDTIASRIGRLIDATLLRTPPRLHTMLGIARSEPLTRVDAVTGVLVRVFFVVLALVMLGSFLHYGLAWDEEVNRIYGDYVANWYSSFFQDRRALSYIEMYMYGGFFEIVAHLFGPLLPFGFYESRHFLNAIFGFFAVVFAFKTGAHLGGRVAGLLSAVCLALTPVFYGHLFVNPKDIPFATFGMATLYYAFLCYDALPRPPRQLVAKLAVALGLALGIRVGGVILIGYVGLLWGFWVVSAFLKAGSADRRSVLLSALLIARALGVVLAIGWVIMLVCWPWAQTSPIGNPIQGIINSAHFVFWSGKVFFMGQMIPASELPWSYLPTWFISAMPEFYFLALAIGAGLVLTRVIQLRTRRLDIDHGVKIAVLVLASLFPPAVAILVHSVIYDGIRQFLFVVPPMAVLSGTTLAVFLQSGAPRWLRQASGAVLLGSMLLTAVDMVQLHPYEYVYFNRAFAGGEAGGATKLETDYWGLSYKEGIDWLRQNYRPTTTDPVRVANCSRPFLTEYFIDEATAARSRFVNVPLDGNPQIFLATTRFGCQASVKGRLLHVVEREDTPLLYIFQM